MLEAIQSRELISVVIDGLCLRGTYHKPFAADSSNTGEEQPSRTGVLFINSGYAPRAAFGNTAVEWAGWFADRGYPAFRMDLPGLGDSDGELPESWLELSDLINQGFFVPAICGIVEHLAKRYNVSGFVVIGHCGGAVSAVHAANANKYIRGLVLLDPYFFRNEEQRPAIRQELSQWVTRSKIGAGLSKIYRQVKRVRAGLNRNRLPENTNLPFLRSWTRIASAGTPILVLNARGPSQSRGDFDYFAYLTSQSGRRGRMQVKFIDGADHSFADAVGRSAVRQCTEQFLSNYFPLNAAESADRRRLVFHHD